MKRFEDYCVPDIRGATTHWTFVLESPHIAEIELGYPAAGSSGEIMSEVLLGNEQAIGKLLQKKNPIVSDYSVMNASSIPLQIGCYKQANLQREIAELSNARCCTDLGVVAAKMTVKHALNSLLGNRITQNLERRLKRQLQLHPNGIFIVCGVVAQAIFEVATSAEGWFHKTTEISLWGRKTVVFYENHPSEQSSARGSKWKDSANMMPLLKLLGR